MHRHARRSISHECLSLCGTWFGRLQYVLLKPLLVVHSHSRGPSFSIWLSSCWSYLTLGIKSIKVNLLVSFLFDVIHADLQFHHEKQEWWPLRASVAGKSACSKCSIGNLHKKNNLLALCAAGFPCHFLLVFLASSQGDLNHTNGFFQTVQL